MRHLSTRRRGLAPARRGAATLLALALGLTLAACGDDGGDEPQAAPTSTATVTATPTDDPDVPEVSQEPVRRPTPGLIEVDGDADSLTQTAAAGYNADSANRVSKDLQGDDRAFGRLCLGDIDLVDSSRPISPEEFAICQARGIDVYQFQVGADALVLAIANETDVGGDCLSTDEAREIFRAGSQINNWSQVREGYDDIPLDTGGPNVEDSVFQFFDRYVLNSNEPSSVNFRADYLAFDEEDQTRNWVAGSDADRRLSRFYASVNQRRTWMLEKLRELNEVVAGKNELVADKLAARDKSIEDKWRPEEKIQAENEYQAALDDRTEWRVIRNAFRARFQPVNKRYQWVSRAQRRLDETLGNLGIFQFSYYQVYEDRLRPFEIEIEDDGDTELNCIFPSPATIISGEYPLARQLLITTTSEGLARDEVRDFIKYYLTNADEVAADSAVVAVPQQDLNRQLRWLETDRTPALELVDGSVQAEEVDPETGAEPESEEEPEPTEAPSPENPAR